MEMKTKLFYTQIFSIDQCCIRQSIIQPLHSIVFEHAHVHLESSYLTRSVRAISLLLSAFKELVFIRKITCFNTWSIRIKNC